MSGFCLNQERYLSDYEDRLVYILFCDLITREIISIKINIKTENTKTIQLN